MGSLGNLSDYPPNTNELLQDAKSSLTKTRSYDDLICVSGHNGGLTRRSSDPNMTADMHAANAATTTTTTTATVVATTTNNGYGAPHTSTDPSIETMSEDGILTESEVNEDEIGRLCQSASPDEEDIRNGDYVEKHQQLPEEMNCKNVCDCQATPQNLNNDFGVKVDPSPMFDVTAEQSKDPIDYAGNAAAAAADVVDGKMKKFFNDCMLHSVNLNGNFCFPFSMLKFLLLLFLCAETDDENHQQNHNEAMKNTWHGDIQTSTDTLVPMDDPSIIINNPLLLAADCRGATSIDTLNVIPVSKY